MKKLLPFLAFFLLLMTSYFLAESYAVFESDVNVQTQNELASWQIMVNGSQITGVTNNFTVETVNWTTSSNVLPGRAAPSLSGYFEIIINPNDTEVSFEYEMFFDFESLNNNMIQITSVKDADLNDLTLVDTNTYSGIITLAQIENSELETVRVDFTWTNNDSNDEIDSQHVNQFDSYLNIPVAIKLTQYIE